MRVVEESADGQYGLYDIEGIRVEVTGIAGATEESRVQVLLPPDPAPWQELLYHDLINDIATHFGVVPRWGSPN
jgi:hypothetical protein